MPSELLALGELFRTCDPAPEHAMAGAYGASELARNGIDSDALALELVSDSAEAPAAEALRSWPGGRETRELTFVLPGRVVELDLVSTVPGMFRATGMVISRAGQAVPTGAVALRHPAGQCVGELDAHGGFRIDDVPAGPLSVLLRTARSGCAVADWLVC
ncbi:hypothetical protein [Haloactinomyces albus]|uniref:Uncharacterized protein n=1 Tax=Haloactinomyces albus TaxID=1352928 RepID=A0AAE3ZCD6_9ACTN|nr:hypothetical protein [Haloactinomyces albus]MDR7302316.1 hypothetical protein [Haloactinomyces albus]